MASSWSHADAPDPLRPKPPERTMRPVYVDRLPPCNSVCPAGENVQAWLGEAQAGRYRQAWEIIVRDNSLPAVHGRVCYHPCEDSCNRKVVDEAVSIHAVERMLAFQMTPVASCAVLCDRHRRSRTAWWGSTTQAQDPLPFTIQDSHLLHVVSGPGNGGRGYGLLDAGHIRRRQFHLERAE